MCQGGIRMGLNTKEKQAVTGVKATLSEGGKKRE
jgi:hypothetical protein